MENREQKTFKIEGMHCASCSALIEKTLSGTEGVHSISVNLASESAKIDFNSSLLSFTDVEKRIKDLGYKVVKEKKEDEAKNYFRRFLLALLLSLPIALSMFIDPSAITSSHLHAYHILILLCGTIVILVTGSNFHGSFFTKLRRLEFTMDSLISIGSLTAFLYSIWAYFTERPFHHFLEGGTFIITFILLGKYLEAHSRGKASEALQKLFELQIKKATALRQGREELVDIDSVTIGEIILVKSGEKIPLDGSIIDGSAHIDESMITGESVPVFKEKQADVYAATFVMDGILTIKVTKSQNDTIFSRIIAMVEETQNKKPPIQHLADKVAGVFVPTIMGIALVTFLGWLIISGGNIAKALLPAVAVLVVACPCALGLATPTAIMVGTGIGAHKGIIIKDGDAFEKSGKIDYVVFDKTGTMTRGKPEVTDILPISLEEESLLRYALSLALTSNHPLSKTIALYARTLLETRNSKLETRNSDVLAPEQLQNIREIIGKGMQGVSMKHGHLLLMGNQRLMEENTIIWNKETSEKIDTLSSEGKTMVFLAINGILAGIFGLMDVPKQDAERAVKELQYMGKEVFMITGDNQKTALSIGMKLGLKKENVIAEVLPHEKAERIIQLQKQGKKVAFVGDGINDAPALATADLGIAIGTGSDIAIETGSMVLVKGDPLRVVTAMKLSGKTYRIIKQNLFWAFFYNLIGVPLAAFGILPPAFASLAMSFSSVSVVSNSLRIKRGF